MKNIIMIGMPGCGKSTVGVILAKTLGKNFLDTDLLIQIREGDLLQNLIDRKGMDVFLAAEEKALLSIESEDTVIATGGSAVYSDIAMKYLSTIGTIVYLELSYETICQRLDNINTRGIAMGEGETLKNLYEKRIPLYETYADIRVNVEGLNVEKSVEAIISELLQ
ncbi:MAG: shikimate kinase [Eubacteriales bacterium]|nr:shikimate kinase [Eubacteriales bacterium]MDD3349306.1 shikimate kinase [Eubacteriales bacterium]